MKTTEKKNAVAPGTKAMEASMACEVTDMGEVRIHENVISTLVHDAALRVEGVSKLAGSTLVNNIAEIVGSRRMQDRAIAVSFEDDNRVVLEIKVNLKFGVRIPNVTSELQQRVIEAVERSTGMTVKRVNVIVQALDAEVEESEEGEVAEFQPIEPVR